jgi:protease-4
VKTRFAVRPPAARGTPLASPLTARSPRHAPRTDAPVVPPPDLVLVVSLLGNLVLFVGLVLVLLAPSTPPEPALHEQHYSGELTAPDKVAVVRVSGMLIEGGTGYARKQIEQAAKDKAVKAVVVRIDSPGGTISASEELHEALTDLRDNTHPRFAGTAPKPIVASMGTIAASGGYYIAMPAERVVAEKTTITGSIGVFAMLPNVSDLANQNGVRVELIKAGAIKAGGSPFQSLTPDERQPWQDMVDHAYDRFLGVVAAGRPKLTKEQLVHEKTERVIPVYTDKGEPAKGADGKPQTTKHVRYRAAGGTFTPPQAQELGLIDDIADLPAAIKLAAQIANLSNYRAVQYERDKGLVELLLGVNTRQPAPLGPEALLSAATPRLWYLAPGFELSGAIAAPPVR